MYVEKVLKNKGYIRKYVQRHKEVQNHMRYHHSLKRL
jgi:hypothetical protein